MEQQNREPDPYRCKVCNDFFVVQVLARCCEMKHDGVVFERRLEQKTKKEREES